MRILLLGNYIPDGQQSMQRFTELMHKELLELGHEVRVTRPAPMAGKFPGARGAAKKWLGYIDKFLLFPAKLQRETDWADFVHICDHSSAMYVKYISKTPHAVTCHDLFGIRSALGEIPENSTGWTGRNLQKMIVAGLKRAQHIVCISDATRSDLIRVLGIPPERTSRIYNSLNYPFRPMEREEALSRLRILKINTDEVFVLHVGGNQWYKNRLGVLRIFGDLRERMPDVQLVMVGKPFTSKMREYISASGLSSSVREVVNASDEDVRACYSLASVMLFPSLQEGFGWPIIEAQACGCPVVTSNRAPLTEVGGTAAVYVDPQDTGAAAISVAETLRRGRTPEVEARNLENARRFPMTGMTRSYVKVFESLMNSDVPVKPATVQ